MLVCRGSGGNADDGVLPSSVSSVVILLNGSTVVDEVAKTYVVVAVVLIILLLCGTEFCLGEEFFFGRTCRNPKCLLRSLLFLDFSL